MLTLYYAPGSSSFAAHIALNEIGAPFEGRRLSIPNKETRTPEYLAVNPAGKVPTLLIDGRVLTEVAAILFYLAKRFPEAGLLPADDDIERQAQVHFLDVIRRIRPAPGVEQGPRPRHARLRGRKPASRRHAVGRR